MNERRGYLENFSTLMEMSPVSLDAWQHINVIGKYEFYNRSDFINIQELIENIIADLKIDISAVGLD